jgi:hypothetical protein
VPVYERSICGERGPSNASHTFQSSRDGEVSSQVRRTEDSFDECRASDEKESLGQCYYSLFGNIFVDK